MGGRKTPVSLELNTDHVQWLQQMQQTYGLFDDAKALRVVLDYVIEEADPATIFGEVRCNHCRNVGNQD